MNLQPLAYKPVATSLSSSLAKQRPFSNQTFSLWPLAWELWHRTYTQGSSIMCQNFKLNVTKSVFAFHNLFLKPFFLPYSITTTLQHVNDFKISLCEILLPEKHTKYYYYVMLWKLSFRLGVITISGIAVFKNVKRRVSLKLKG